MIFVENSPLPEPEIILVGSVVIGLGDVDQTTPLEVTVAPPLAITEFMNDPDEVFVGKAGIPVATLGVVVPDSVVNVAVPVYQTPWLIPLPNTASAAPLAKFEQTKPLT